MELFIKNIFNILKPSYWFNLAPGQFLPGVANVLYIFFAIMIVFSIASKIMQNKNKKDTLTQKMWSKFYYFFATLGIFGLILVFFRQQMVYFLSAPFWLILWFVGLLVWLFFIIRYIKITIPRVRADQDLKKEMEKYLPKK